MSSEQSLQPRSRAADYEFLDKLGRGNSGTVFKVRRRSDRKFYVVKQVCNVIIARCRRRRDHLVVQVDIGCVSPEEQAEALNECSILASMNHPNVIQCVIKHLKPFLICLMPAAAI
jgi:serine/threonine protein kinase